MLAAVAAAAGQISHDRSDDLVMIIEREHVDGLVKPYRYKGFFQAPIWLCTVRNLSSFSRKSRAAAF
jgi:hypothetical protein